MTLSIGEKIKELRKKRNISQAELAKNINVSAGNVGDWEREKAKPGADALIALSEFFGITTDWILKGEEEFQKLTSISVEIDELQYLMENWIKLTERQKGRIENQIEQYIIENETKERNNKGKIG